MNEPILKTVAAPVKLFWAPFLPALANIALQSPIMIILIGIYNVNPLFVVSTIFGMHLFLIVAGAKEPHLSRMMQSQGPFIVGYKSIYKKPGRKLAS
ncbi:MAG: hypothetical protein IJC30_03955 [Alphaproteobacteria bacterium]|nr:hypothetical protein [Alphaproteobacteria bacterium]